jgi:hypothetical protein
MSKLDKQVQKANKTLETQNAKLKELVKKVFIYFILMGNNYEVLGRIFAFEKFLMVIFSLEHRVSFAWIYF